MISHLPTPGNKSGNLAPQYRRAAVSIGTWSKARLTERFPSRGRNSWFMCLEPLARLTLAPLFSQVLRPQATFPTPLPAPQTPFPAESFFSKPETLIQTSESEVSNSESNDRNLFQIEINCRQTRRGSALPPRYPPRRPALRSPQGRIAIPTITPFAKAIDDSKLQHPSPLNGREDDDLNRAEKTVDSLP